MELLVNQNNYILTFLFICVVKDTIIFNNISKVIMYWYLTPALKSELAKFEYPYDIQGNFFSSKDSKLFSRIEMNIYDRSVPVKRKWGSVALTHMSLSSYRVHLYQWPIILVNKVLEVSLTLQIVWWLHWTQLVTF